MDANTQQINVIRLPSALAGRNLFYQAVKISSLQNKQSKFMISISSGNSEMSYNQLKLGTIILQQAGGWTVESWKSGVIGSAILEKTAHKILVFDALPAPTDDEKRAINEHFDVYNAGYTTTTVFSSKGNVGLYSAKENKILNAIDGDVLVDSSDEPFKLTKEAKVIGHIYAGGQVKNQATASSASVNERKSARRTTSPSGASQPHDNAKSGSFKASPFMIASGLGVATVLAASLAQTKTVSKQLPDVESYADESGEFLKPSSVSSSPRPPEVDGVSNGQSELPVYAKSQSNQFIKINNLD